MKTYADPNALDDEPVEEYEPDRLIHLYDDAKLGRLTPFLNEYLLRVIPSRDDLFSCVARPELTKNDPLLFALMYLPEHISQEDGSVSFAEFHLELIEQAKNEWTRPLTTKMAYRDAYIAPRGIGKSTWLFLLLPMWAAAHEHIKYIVAFSDSLEQSRTHLMSFRNELDFNDLLRQDFPDLVEPKIRNNGTGRTTSQNTTMIHQANEFIFAAKGAGSSARGMKVGNLRPELIILDDIEPGEEKYSASGVSKRLTWLTETVKYLNLNARVVLVGTVTMVGSIMHQLLQHELEPSKDDAEWIQDQLFKVHYHSPFGVDEDGSERSTWPEKWSLEWLIDHRSQRSFKKEMLNQPINTDGTFWSAEDITYGNVAEARLIISVDPAVTSTSKSDFTGVTVLAYSPYENKVAVRFAQQYRIPNRRLREVLLALLEEFPDVGLVLVETNQGGDLWQTILTGMPVRVKLMKNTEPKTYRAERLLIAYQRGRVVHVEEHKELEEQMLSYQGKAYGEQDDLIDAVGTGVMYFLKRKKNVQPVVKQVNYV